VFNPQWIAASMPDAELRRLRALAREEQRKRREAERLRQLAVAKQAEAEAQREEHRQHLVRVYVGRGTERLDQGDTLGALPWLMEALHLDRGHPDAERIHRVRIGFLLRHSPRLVQMWFREKPLGPVDLSPDGKRVLITSGNRA